MNVTRVLIIEHEERVSRVLCRIFKRLDLEPTSANNYKDFIGLYSKLRPEIIFLSLDTPDGNHSELFNYLVEQQSQATIFLLSNMDEDKLSKFEEIGQASGLNMGGILRKPIDIDSVNAKLQNWASKVTTGP